MEIKLLKTLLLEQTKEFGGDVENVRMNGLPPVVTVALHVRTKPSILMVEILCVLCTQRLRENFIQQKMETNHPIN